MYIIPAKKKQTKIFLLFIYIVFFVGLTSPSNFVTISNFTKNFNDCRVLNDWVSVSFVKLFHPCSYVCCNDIIQLVSWPGTLNYWDICNYNVML